MTLGRLLRLERRLMAAEYLLDSTIMHVRNSGCDDIKPLALARIQSACNDVRASISLVRNAQGARHPTLFAGRAGVNSPANLPEKGGRGQKQKSWGGSVGPHKWRKDCDDRRTPTTR